jgi:hypothetical protein
MLPRRFPTYSAGLFPFSNARSRRYEDLNMIRLRRRVRGAIASAGGVRATVGWNSTSCVVAEWVIGRLARYWVRALAMRCTTLSAVAWSVAWPTVTAMPYLTPRQVNCAAWLTT